MSAAACGVLTLKAAMMSDRFSLPAPTMRASIQIMRVC
jgi:hypothetical protein